MAVNLDALPGPETITREVLPNGITVLIYENHHIHSVVVNGSLHAGSIYTDPSRGGLASLTATSLMRGTQNRDFDAIFAGLEDIGADLGFRTGTHQIGFGGKALAEDLHVLVDTLADVLRYPTFPAEQVERLRGQRLTWLQYRQQDTRWLAARAFRWALYPEHHPYHYSTRGTLQTLPTLTVDEMRAFHQQIYGPQGMILTIVGAIDTHQALDTVRAALGDWQKPDQPPAAELPTMQAPAEINRQHKTVPGKTQSDMVIGTVGPSRFAPDYRAATLANSILGQFGMMGRIGDVVREREGMAYYAYSNLEGGFGPGAWSISAGVNPANVERAYDLCVDELRRITTELVSEDDLADNQSYFTGQLPLQMESAEGIASVLLTLETFDLGLDYIRRYPDVIYSITREDVLAAAQQYLNPDALVVSVAGPG